MKIKKFQELYNTAVRKLLGDDAVDNTQERNHRFIEEAIELVQANGMSKSAVMALVDHVFSKPVGEIKQEAGGVLATFTTLCVQADIDIDEIAQDELDWADSISVEWFRARQSRKPAIEPNPDVFLDRPVTLHPRSFKLASDMYSVMVDKLKKSEQKYGYSDEWAQADAFWPSPLCVVELKAHIEKGDPIDVMLYCAFLHYHGMSTTGEKQ